MKGTDNVKNNVWFPVENRTFEKKNFGTSLSIGNKAWQHISP